MLFYNFGPSPWLDHFQNNEPIFLQISWIIMMSLIKFVKFLSWKWVINVIPHFSCRVDAWSLRVQELISANPRLDTLIQLSFSFSRSQISYNLIDHYRFDIDLNSHRTIEDHKLKSYYKPLKNKTIRNFINIKIID